MGFARRLAPACHVDDLVAEAFTKVLDALQRDLGPTVSFRPYLLTTIRSIWANTVRTESRYDLVEDYEAVTSPALTDLDDPDGRFDNGAVAMAYRSLPERWQAVLWYTAVENLPHATIATHLGIKPNAVAALNFRAREGLRQAFLSQHLATSGMGACGDVVQLLPAYSRGKLDRRKVPGVQDHLAGCASCAAALADLKEVNNRLGALLIPIVLGISARDLGWSAKKGALLASAKNLTASLVGWAASIAVVCAPLFLASDGIDQAMTVGAAPAPRIVLAPVPHDPVPMVQPGARVGQVTPVPSSALTAEPQVDTTPSGRVGRSPKPGGPASEISVSAAPEPGIGLGAPEYPQQTATIAPPVVSEAPDGPPETSQGSDMPAIVTPAEPVEPELDDEPAGPADNVPVSVALEQLNNENQAGVILRVNVNDLTAGTTLVLTGTDLLQPPTPLSPAGWSCASSRDEIRTTGTGTLSCSWLGGDAVQGELRVLVNKRSETVVTVVLSIPSDMHEHEPSTHTVTVSLATADE
jgi:RNA polymerase sigma factor (sigma-70 family)